MNRFRVFLLLLAVIVSLGLFATVGARTVLPLQNSQVAPTPVVPSFISYQGRVTVGGSPYTGTGYFQFAIVDSSETSHWSSGTLTATVADGYFAFPALGSTSPITAGVFVSSDRLLRVWFSADGSTFEQLSPDTALSSVPYAQRAEQVDWTGVQNQPATVTPQPTPTLVATATPQPTATPIFTDTGIVNRHVQFYTTTSITNSNLTTFGGNTILTFGATGREYTFPDTAGTVALLNVANAFANNNTVASGKFLTALTDGSTGGLRAGASSDVLLYRGAANTWQTPDNLTSDALITGNQLQSTVASGTAPLVVASTTVVANLNASALQGNAASAFAVAAKGVTNGDSHDHSGGDGAQINHTTLSNIGTNTHAQIDTYVNAAAYRLIPLTIPLSSTSWDGDLRSTSTGSIDLNAVFGTPAGIKAVILTVSVRETGALGGGTWFAQFGPGASYTYACQAFALGGNTYASTMGTVPVASDGKTIYYSIGASGTNTINVYIYIWGYFI